MLNYIERTSFPEVFKSRHQFENNCVGPSK